MALWHICVLLHLREPYIAIYTDAGFATDSNVIRAFIGFNFLTAAQLESNRIMARVRVTIEWGFGRIRAQCPLITCEKILKLRSGKFSLLTRNAVLLSNYRRMLGENPVSLYFRCPPHTLEEYFAWLHILYAKYRLKSA